jgi:hypothetical protein
MGIKVKLSLEVFNEIYKEDGQENYCEIYRIRLPFALLI